jgi:3-oxoacyl-[acyl-carrier protein] reductase
MLTPFLPSWVAEPEDIADAVVLVASEGARWMTGQVIQVAGGHAL